ncbi:uncharacterized protein LOC117587255 [Drosophila guanche]|uniref:Uncharacterized protein n=1 Tax=Drosophila guanche TaxID=7266 RepID=A0A3B0JIW3_DROGU|nr:uncharacterized protein LOC117587255 [Drosophila guanche]SPP73369.1 Hypothetical predicted protein [Drosophila guanche]
MSSLTDAMYYAQISCPKRKLTILRGFIWPTLDNIFDAAAQIGIVGRYLISAKDNTIIGDHFALRYLLERQHTILVCDSLDGLNNEKVCLEVSGETATEEAVAQGLELELTNSEEALLKGVTSQVVIAFRQFLSRQKQSKA